KVISGTAKAPLRYLLFDLPSLAGSDLAATRLEDRKALLADLLEGADPVLALSQHIVGHGAEVFAASKRQGMEGIVSKQLGARYAAGRSTSWVKTKHAEGDEFVIVGYTAPKRSRTGFGSLLMATREDGALRYVGRVGTGFDDDQLRKLKARMQPLTRTQTTVALPAHIPRRPRDGTWIEPKLVAEQEYRGWGKEGLLRQASFKGLREDKTVDEVGKGDGKAKKTGMRKAGKPGSDEAPRISSPDRVVY